MAERECIFCALIEGKIPSKKVYEDSYVVAALDINPRNPGHTIVIPRTHVNTIFEMKNEDLGNVFQSVKNVAIKVMNAMKAQGINILQSNGASAGQMVPHVHFHIIPRYANEGPVSLEGILQVKKMDDAMMDKIAERIEEAEVVKQDDIESAIDTAIDKAVPEPIAKEEKSFAPKKEKKDDSEDIDFNF